MNIKNLHKIIEDQPRFRHNQVNEAVFCSLIGNWAEASNLPKSLQERLNEECPLEIQGRILESKIAPDVKKGGTVKAIITLADGMEVETVLMLHGERNTVCVSSQVGCPLACRFCATGQMGFRRNLDEHEIVEQVLFFARYLKTNFGSEQKVTNVVFMGMGEPFLNYDHVWTAIRILNSEEKFGIGARRISISTAGIIEGIRRMIKEDLQINLAISLHAPMDGLRTDLMPINKHNPLVKLLGVVEQYIEITNRKVMLEYVLIQGVNDSLEYAKKLAEIADHPLYMVNLISYNETGVYKPSSPDQAERFKRTLEKKGIAVTLRHHYGGEIKAACGQLGKIKSEVMGEKSEVKDKKQDAGNKKSEVKTKKTEFKNKKTEVSGKNFSGGKIVKSKTGARGGRSGLAVKRKKSFDTKTMKGKLEARSKKNKKN